MTGAVVPGGAPAPADAPHPMDLDTAIRMVQLGAPMPDGLHRGVELVLMAALDAARADVERLRGLWPKNGFGEDMNVHQLVANHRAWSKRAWEAQSAAETERDALRAEAERLREECNATADTVLELAAQRAAALADCRDLQREVELLRGQVGAWDSAQAVWDVIGRIRKSLGGDTDV